MTKQDLILMRVQYSEPVTLDEENARRDIEALAGEIERLWAQLAAAQAKLDAVPVDAINKLYEEGIDESWQEWPDADEVVKIIGAWLKVQFGL